MNPNDQWPGHLAIEMECVPTEKRYEKSKGERHGLVSLALETTMQLALLGAAAPMLEAVFDGLPDFLNSMSSPVCSTR